MMKIKRIFSLLLCLLLLVCMSACGSSDFKSGGQGEWVIYHYYERAENGVDVFLDETNYYTVTIDDKSFSVVAEDGALENIGGTYEWSKAGEAEVVMNDGTRCTVQVSKNSKKHNENAEWDLYVVETNMYYVLETKEGAN